MPVVKYCPKKPVMFMCTGNPYVYSPKAQRYYSLNILTNRWSKMGGVVLPQGLKTWFGNGVYQLLTAEQKAKFPSFNSEDET